MTYLSLEETNKILILEEPKLYTDFEKLEESIKLYALQKTTQTIEDLGIYKGSRELTFPLPFQKKLTLNFKICFAVETLYSALNIESEEIRLAKMAVVSESDKTASNTYDIGIFKELKNCPFKSLKAYNIIKKFIPKSFNMR